MVESRTSSARTRSSPAGPGAAGGDVRGQVLAAATRLFAARGFDGTALQDVADEVGVTKPAVLHHFPSKEALRAAVLDGIVSHWNATLPRLLEAATASEDRFDAVFGELWRFFASDPHRARLVLREALDRPGEMKRLLRGPVRPWLDAIVGYIRAGQEAGRHWPTADAEAYVIHVVLLVVTAAASTSVVTPLLEDGGTSKADASRRYARELTRIAKTALFQAEERTVSRREATTKSRSR
jgi:TetR/AcrR family transcriptional regulator